MASPFTFEIPQEEKARFDSTLKEYIKLNRRSMRDIVNAKALDLAHKSLINTIKVNPERIRYELGQVGTQLGTTKKGRVSFNRRRASAILKEDSFASRIVNANRIKRGHKPISGEALEVASRKLIGRRVASAAFISSGWIPAIRRMSAVSKDNKIKTTAANLQGAKQIGRPKGGARAAMESPAPFATITNSATVGEAGAGEQVKRGLRLGIQAVIADMREYIIRKTKEAQNGRSI